jgi:hypothetical protein
MNPCAASVAAVSRPETQARPAWPRPPNLSTCRKAFPNTRSSLEYRALAEARHGIPLVCHKYIIKLS